MGESALRARVVTPPHRAAYKEYDYTITAARISIFARSQFLFLYPKAYVSAESSLKYTIKKADVVSVTSPQFSCRASRCRCRCFVEDGDRCNTNGSSALRLQLGRCSLAPKPSLFRLVYSLSTFFQHSALFAARAIIRQARVDGVPDAAEMLFCPRLWSTPLRVTFLLTSYRYAGIPPLAMRGASFRRRYCTHLLYFPLAVATGYRCRGLMRRRDCRRKCRLLLLWIAETSSVYLAKRVVAYFFAPLSLRARALFFYHK